MKSIYKKLTLVVLMVLIVSALSGCYLWKDVSANEVGIKLSSNAIEGVVGAGKYSGGAWKKLELMDVSAKTITWSDPDLWTADKQPVSFEITVTYARKSDADSVAGMWTKYNSQATDDAALETLVRSRIPRVAKQITTSMTLDGMLGIASGDTVVTDNPEIIGREKLQQQMFDLLKNELSEFYVELLDVGVNNIAPDQTYADMLTQKAVSKLAVELAQQDTLKLQEQVKQEQAQTQVALEIADRNNQVREIENKIYVLNPQAYQLRYLELLKDVIGDQDKIYFIPQGADLNLYLTGGATTGIPIQTDETN